MNEKYFPKRARFIIANKLIDSIMNVSANFFAANAIYPNNEEKLKIREQYQIIGKSNLSALEHQLNVANQLFNIPDGVLNEIFGLTSQINKKYNKWFKSGRKVLNRELQQTCGKPTPLGVGWIAHLFYSLMCMLLLILYTYYDIVDVWKINIDIQTQQYL